MSALHTVSRTLKKTVSLPVLALVAGVIGFSFAGTTAAQAQGTPPIPTLYDSFPLGSGGPSTALPMVLDGGSFASGRNDGYAHQENKGAGKNGPGTAQYRKTSGGFAGAPKGSHGVTSYIDGGGGTQRVDFTHPDDKRRPVIVFIHGGGWRGDGGQYNQQFRERVAQQGFASFRIRYRLIADGTYGIFNDVMNAIEHLRNNADTYNIDPARVITWGDSAGGSLSVRTGASGKAGTATAVGWSAPTNAFRSFLFSPASLAIGIDHSTCFSTGFTDVAGDLMEVYRGWDYLLQDPQRFNELGPQDLIAFSQSTMQALHLIQNNDVLGQLQGSLAEWGIDINRLSSLYGVARDSANRLEDAANNIKPEEAEQETGTKPENSSLQAFKDELNTVIEGLSVTSGDSKTIASLKERLEKIRDELPAKPGEEGTITIKAGKEEVLQITIELRRAAGSSDINQEGSLINDLGQSTRDNPEKSAQEPPTEDDARRAHLSMLDTPAMKRLSDALGSIRSLGTRDNLSDEQQAEVQSLSEIAQQVTSSLQSNTNNFTSATNSGGSSGNPQFNPVNKIAECADNLIQTSPALFASPNSPPMFLANASHETLVPPQDAYEMRDKIRSFGTRADVIILEGSNHMGYDERAVEPTLSFLRSVNHPEAISR